MELSNKKSGHFCTDNALAFKHLMLRIYFLSGLTWL